MAKSGESNVTVILDNSSVELFADGGLTCMTDIFFPEKPLDEWRMEADGHLFDHVQFNQLKSIWITP
jgi:fructan beta-fructosidase